VAEFFGIVGVFGSQHGPRPTPDHLLPVHPATDRLRTDPQLVLLQQQEHDRGTGPTAPQEAEVAWGLFGHPVDDPGCPPIEEHQRPSPPRCEDRFEPFPLQPVLPVADGAGTGVQHGSDLTPGAAVGQQQQDVSPQGDVRIGRFAIMVQQGLAFRGVQSDTAVGGLVSGVCWFLANDNPTTKPVFITRSVLPPLSLLCGLI